jgi:hypothetical protein
VHYVTKVEYGGGYAVTVWFEDGAVKCADLQPYLEGEVFEPLRDRRLFATVRLNPDIDTIVWENGADMSPDFLYEIGRPILKVAEGRSTYG